MASNAAEQFAADFVKVQADLDQLAKAADDLDATLRNPDADVESLEKANAAADDTISRLRATIVLLEQLEAMPLSNEQATQVAQAKSSAQALLDRATASKNALASLIGLLQQSQQNHGPANEMLHDIHSLVTGLIDKYLQPQPLPIGKHDLIAFDNLLAQLPQQAAAVDELKRLGDQMPQLAYPRQEATRLADQLQATQVALQVCPTLTLQTEYRYIYKLYFRTCKRVCKPLSPPKTCF